MYSSPPASILRLWPLPSLLLLSLLSCVSVALYPTLSISRSSLTTIHPSISLPPVPTSRCLCNSHLVSSLSVNLLQSDTAPYLPNKEQFFPLPLYLPICLTLFVITWPHKPANPHLSFPPLFSLPPILISPFSLCHSCHSFIPYCSFTTNNVTLSSSHLVASVYPSTFHIFVVQFLNPLP